jgi:ketosteroid isomerase-like protein
MSKAFKEKPAKFKLQTNSSDTEKVKQTVLNIYGAFEKLDAVLLDENFEHSEELLAFGTDQDEKFQGWNEYKDVHSVQFKAVKRFVFTPKELEVHVDENLAWFSDRPHWNLETKAGEKVDSDMRITGVLRKDRNSGRWRVVQWHVSSGVQRLHEY